MKNILVGVLTTILISFLVILLFEKSSIQNYLENDVAIGQIWVYDSCSEDPFKDPCPKRYKVLDIKNGFVKYLNMKDNFESSCSLHWFLVGAVLEK